MTARRLLGTARPCGGLFRTPSGAPIAQPLGLWIGRLLGTLGRLLGTASRLLGTFGRLLGTAQNRKPLAVLDFLPLLPPKTYLKPIKTLKTAQPVDNSQAKAPAAEAAAGYALKGKPPQGRLSIDCRTTCGEAQAPKMNALTASLMGWQGIPHAPTRGLCFERVRG